MGRNASTNPDRAVKGKGGAGMRDKATIKRLKMYNSRAKRDKDGKFVSGEYMSKEVGKPARVEPNRRWFGNTHVIGQAQLDKFREEMAKKQQDTYSVLLKSHKLPMALLTDPSKGQRMDLLSVEKFSDTFGKKSTRKRPKLSAAMSESVEQLASGAAELFEAYEEKGGDSNVKPTETIYKDESVHRMFEKGQSRRIWSELYKVIDSSDVIIQVLDARDPIGTRSKHVENYLRKHAKHKHLILVLNKADLVPTWVTARWVKILSAEYPTLAFHSSITNPFGKGALIHLLRQFAQLHIKDKKQISVGFVGYPNAGKSSIINTLRKKKVCKTAPIPGETKVWQYITLMKRIYLIDCPGVVYSQAGDTHIDSVLKGVIRIENLDDATEFIPAVLERVRHDHLVNTYPVSKWEDHYDFLTQMAKASGRLLKKGEPDMNTVAKMVLTDWIRGKLPFFKLPPELTEEEIAARRSAADAERAKNIEEKLAKSRGIAPGSNDEVREQAVAEAAAKRVAGVQQIFKNLATQPIFNHESGDGQNTVAAAEAASAEANAAKAASRKRTKAGDDGDAIVSAPPQVDWDKLYKDVGDSDDDFDDLEAMEARAIARATRKAAAGKGKGKGKGKATKAAAAAAAAAANDDDDDDEDEPEQPSAGKRARRAGNKDDGDDSDSSDGAGGRKRVKRQQKDARVKTNKGKQRAGVHFFETANVKNKNRNRTPKPADLSGTVRKRKPVSRKNRRLCK